MRYRNDTGVPGVRIFGRITAPISVIFVTNCQGQTRKEKLE
jgi:hypothetical protein